MRRREAELAEATRSGIPVLGICFGHQMLAQALGGRVEKNPRGREIGTVELRLSEPDPLLGDAGHWLVNSSHVDSVIELPQGASLLGSTERDPHSVIRFAPSAWGVQFHPEFDAAIVACYLRERARQIAAEGQDPAALERDVQETPAAAAIFERFLRR
jgi:GMP synthase (glutamine-hydrolysing)